MKNVRKVLVALAFSDYAEGIFTFAADFADTTGAELIVASVVNERDVESVRTISAMGYEVDGEHYIENIKKEREQILQGITSNSDLPRDRSLDIRETPAFLEIAHRVREGLRAGHSYDD